MTRTLAPVALSGLTLLACADVQKWANDPKSTSPASECDDPETRANSAACVNPSQTSRLSKEKCETDPNVRLTHTRECDELTGARAARDEQAANDEATANRIRSDATEIRSKLKEAIRWIDAFEADLRDRHQKPSPRLEKMKSILHDQADRLGRLEAMPAAQAVANEASVKKLQEQLPTLIEGTRLATGNVASTLEAAAREAKDVARVENECLTGSECEPACASGDQFACIRVQVGLYGQKATDPSVEKGAREVFQKACDSGLQYGCSSLRDVERAVAIRGAAVDDLWGTVETWVNELAAKRYFPRLARKLAPATRNPRQNLAAADRMDLQLPILIKENYCPARAEFIKAAGPDEFRVRASRKCQEDPPKTSGQGGEEVILGDDCRAIFASACKD